MWRLAFQCLLILSLATNGLALPRPAHAGDDAHAGHHAMPAGHGADGDHAMPAGPGADGDHAMHRSADPAPMDCCEDAGCDCGCSMAAPAVAMRLASSALALSHDEPAPMPVTPLVPLRDAPPLRPPTA